MPCGEIPGPLYAELDDISNKWGHGDLRATTRQAFQLHSDPDPNRILTLTLTLILTLTLTTRQAFQLHGVLKSNLKDVIKVGLRVGLG